MGFKDGFSKFTKSVENSAKSVAKKSGGVMESSKLNKEVASEEDRINKNYMEIGKLVFAKFKEGESFGEDLGSLCSEIVEIQENIEDLKEKIAFLKNMKLCPNCRREMDINTSFCPDCGTKQPMPSLEELNNEVEKEETKEQKKLFCNGCGTELEAGVRFCQNCGAKVE